MRQHAPRMGSREGTRGEPGPPSLTGTADAIVLLFVLQLTWIPAGTIPRLRTHCCFSSEIRGIRFSSRELLWGWPQISVAPKATLSCPVRPRGSRRWPLLIHRLSDFCSSCVLLCLFPNQDIAAVSPWEETARSGAARPLLDIALPRQSPSTSPLCAQHPQPTVPGSLCSAAPARPPRRARQALLSALVRNRQSRRTKGSV